MQLYNYIHATDLNDACSRRYGVFGRTVELTILIAGLTSGNIVPVLSVKEQGLSYAEILRRATK